MATGNETVGIDMLVQPSLDPKAAAQVLRDTAALHKKLSALKVDWSGVTKESGLSIQEIQKLSKSVSAFARNLSDSSKITTTKLAALQEALEDAKKKAASLKDQYALTSDRAAKSGIGKELNSVNKNIAGLSKQIDTQKKASKKYTNELTASQKQVQSQMKAAAQYSWKDMFKNIGNSIGNAKKGGAGAAVGGTISALGKGVGGAGARAGIANTAGMGDLVKGLTELSMGLGAIVGAFGAFLMVIKAASDHQTKLNKTLLEGTGYANDFIGTSKTYTATVDDIRNAAIDAAGSLLQFGGDSEQSMQVLSSYAKEATGSIQKTGEAINRLGGGDLQEGVKTFSRNAIIYGKALGVEATDIAATMGKFESEIGYGANQTQELMSNIVKAAADANMPMTKFMGIFRSVLPDVELYQNRLEELTGTIKLLSSAMSPKDVQKFMGAFSRGFKGMSFKERLGHALVAGVDNVNDALKNDFGKKADAIAEGLGPELGKAYKEAFAKGDTKAIQDTLIQAKAEGKSGTEIGEAQKLYQAEQERRRGGPLGTASAMKAGGMMTTVKVMAEELNRLTKGQGVVNGHITGLGEQVATMRGYSQDQIDSFNQFSDTMETYQRSIQKYGTTGSKSSDAALRKMIAQRMGKAPEDVSAKDMTKATKEDIAQAAEDSLKNAKSADSMADYAVQQLTATKSIGERLENYIGFLLEKLFQVMQDILTFIDKMWHMMSISDPRDLEIFKSSERKLSDIKKNFHATLGTDDQKKVNNAVIGDLGDKMEAQVKSGKNMKEAFADSIDKSLVPLMKDQVDNHEQGLRDIFQSQNKDMKEGDIGVLTTEIRKALDAGDLKDLYSALSDGPGGFAKTLEVMLSRIDIPEEMKKTLLAEKGKMERQAKPIGPQSEKEAQNAKHDSDLVSRDQLERNAQEIAGKVAQEAVMTMPMDNISSGSGVPSTKSTSSDIVKAQENQTSALTKKQDSVAETQKESSEDLYDGINDVASILKKGIKYEKSWMGSQYKNFLKDTTYSAFQQALLEYAVLDAKLKSGAIPMQDFLKFSNKLGEVGLNAVQSVNYGGEDSIEKLFDWFPSKQLGGPIPDAGLYNLHKGEYVLPASQVSDSGKSGNNGPQVVNLNVYGAPNMTPQQFKSSVVQVMGEIARRH